LITIICFIFIYASTGKDSLGAYTYDIISNVEFWFILVISSSMCLIPIIISRKVDLLFSISIINNIRNKKFEDDYLKKTYIKKLENMTKCTRSLARFKRIYKAENEFVPQNYADKKMKEFVELYKNLKKEENKEDEDIEYLNHNLFKKSRSVEPKINMKRPSKPNTSEDTLGTDRTKRKSTTIKRDNLKADEIIKLRKAISDRIEDKK
jgi:hypothetical protein